jgi:hypothetical protein
MLFCLRAEPVYKGPFCGDEGTDGAELAAGVGLAGGQPGSNALARRSLTADQPCGTRVSHRGEARSCACRWRVAAGGATRSNGGGLQDHPPLVNPGTEGFLITISAPTIFCEAATRSMCSINPSPSRYPIIDMLPQAVCLALSQRHNARIGGPLTT